MMLDPNPNPEELMIQAQEARAWALRAVRDMPEHALPELKQAIIGLLLHYGPMDALPVPKGKPS